MKTFIQLFQLLSIFVILSSCEPERGCTDNNSLHYDSLAEEDDGSCNYSKVSFYSKWGSVGGVNISKIDVTVNNNPIGAITAVYRNGPGNCSAQGNVPFQFSTGDSVDWNATITLSNGNVLPASGGVVEPSRISECIKVNVAN